MPIHIAYVAADHEAAVDLADRLKRLDYDVAPRTHIPFPIPDDAAISKASAFIFIWSPASVNDGDMKHLIGLAAVQAKQVSVRLRATDRSKIPAAAGTNIILHEDTDAIDAALQVLGVTKITPPVPTPQWDPILVFSGLIAALGVLFLIAVM
ncbi:MULTISPECIES: toll/interleukin-1 receptor domain-containing protein [Rhodomicrobium]|uniref:toll/interleukin-1 receptor domain-containing protein n=1 Tax=Rhodomicrobium TaxID=1068 RepID=UPI000B4A8849|nr:MULTISPECIES: toll/interleukin-1 receptor domain-containing protein [Rhodomicrobium]